MSSLIVEERSGLEQPWKLSRMKFGPSTLRTRAAGVLVVMILIALFSDDTSGNTSKKWNKYESWIMSFPGLQAELRNRPEHVHFLTTSKSAAGFESAEVISNELRITRDGVKGVNPLTHAPILIVTSVLSVVGDNPMHSVIASHTGTLSNRPCRLCRRSGWKNEKDPMRARAKLLEFIGPQQHPSAGIKDGHSVKNFLASLHRRVLEGDIEVGKAISLAAEMGIKDKHFEHGLMQPHRPLMMNPLLGILCDNLRKMNEEPFFDLSLDCPVEILHTVNLGVVKYCMQETIRSLNDAKKQELKARIEGVDNSGFSIPFRGHEMVVKYVGSLNGKDFKNFAQISVFALRGLVPANVQTLWASLAALVVIINGGEIRNIENYCDHLDRILNAMVNAILVSPYCWKMIKPKLHLLRELPFYVKRFGRPKDYASETQESFNKHIRSNIIGSNRQNTSKDVALAFARQAAARHLTAGGLYQVGSIWQSLTIDFCPPQIRMRK
ncbi:hypothetical protein DFJ73DRAFT_631465 [Zopfochytrium polystomum]|nr:hypothetical protein DFJ73DRAFT_631465 [Zopfochytrium polystomum]